jgi:hypothetical protein
MKPERLFSLIFGVALIGIGALSMGSNLLLQTEAWRLWPVVVVIAGLLLTAPGFMGLARRGFGAFFIPGIPVLTTGGILLFASIFHNWGVWAMAWPLEVLGVALGFGLAAIFMRVPALAIPAMIVGVNGLVLGFCNLTGLWQAWALLWPVEPLAVGLGLLVLGLATRSSGANLAGVILCAIAGVGFFMTSFMSMFNFSMLRFAVPIMLVLTGLIIAATSFFVKRDSSPAAKPETEGTNA